MMNCRKGLVAGVVAVCMMGAMGSTSVFAENEANKSTKIEYVVSQSYEWTVPSNFSFSSNELVKEDEVEVTKNVIGEGETLKIGINGCGTNGAFVIKNKATGKKHEIAYTVGKKTEKEAAYATIDPGVEILTVAAGTGTDSVSLQFTLKPSATEIAGEYEGTVSYTAQVE